MKTDWPLFWAVIWKTYKYHMGMALLIFFGYLWNELVPSEDHYSLWYTHGPISLIIPLIVVVPMIVMINDSVKHYKNIRKYYPDGYVNRKNKSK
jgi:beta-lactamase regulating signal transducer with metallopeptidase domain